MDSAKIFALGLAAGLTIAVVARNRSVSSKAEEASPLSKASSKASKNKKKSKAKTNAASAVPAPDDESSNKTHDTVAVSKLSEITLPNANPTVKQNKKTKKQQQSRHAETESMEPATFADAALSSVEPKLPVEKPVIPLNNETVRQRHAASHAVLHDALGDMRDTQVDPVPASYDSVARIPAPVTPLEPKQLSKQDKDDGWSSVGGRPKSAQSSEPQGQNGAKLYSSIASKNPFAALPDDAASSTVKRLPKAGASNPRTSINAGSRASAAAAAADAAETKKQRQNAQKSQAKKQAKEQAEQNRLDRLAQHRREQQTEAAKLRETAKRPTPHSVSSKQPSAKASVDLNGRLVWE